jgi:phosphoenolpyruvate carboxylase
MPDPAPSGPKDAAPAVEALDYAESLTELLLSQLLDVIRTRAPEVEPAFRGRAEVAAGERELLLRTLQAQGIWLQLLNIVEENAAMRARRRLENEIGPDHVPGTFAQVVRNAAAAGVPAEELQGVLDRAAVRPVITAHPTEAKRVTVLEIHRRIYRRLVDLESPRWTARERAALERGLRNEIDLLWLTGELRREKPTVQQEIAWGLHFFDETLFDRVPELLETLEWALARHYPESRIAVPALFRFGSWIGGDRDGNPFVTNEVLREALIANRLASLRRYRQRLDQLVRTLSIAEHTLPLPEGFRRAVARALSADAEGKAIAARNPGEPFRQFTVCMQRRLAATAAAAADGAAPPAAGYAAANDFIADLEAMEAALVGAHSAGLARAFVRPLRREVQTFGFRTTSLDLRENSTVVNRTLAEVWKRLADRPEATPPDPASEAWRKWVTAELKRPLDGLPNCRPRRPALSACSGWCATCAPASTARRSARSSSA